METDGLSNGRVIDLVSLVCKGMSPVKKRKSRVVYQVPKKVEGKKMRKTTRNVEKIAKQKFLMQKRIVLQKRKANLGEHDYEKGI